MDEPIRWTEGDPGAPIDAVELLRALEPPPAMPAEVRLASGARVARLAGDRARSMPRAVWPLGLGLGVGAAAAAVVFAMCTGPAPPRDDGEAVLAAELRRLPSEEGTAGPAPTDVIAPETIPSAPEPPSSSHPDLPVAPAVGHDPVEEPEPSRSGATRAEKGSLSVTSVPWATVLLDGEDVGTTPLRQLRLDPGIHVVELRADGYRDEHRRIQIRSGEGARLQARLRRESRPAATSGGRGTLMINSAPWSRVFIDGRDTGQNTPIVNLSLPAGRHRVELRTADGTRHPFAVEIRAGETTRVVRRLE